MARYTQSIAAALFLLILPSVVFSAETSAIQTQAEEAYAQWVKAIEARDANAIDALYTPDAQMMTSSTSGLISDQQGRLECYKKLFQRPDLTVTTKKKMFDLYDDTTPTMSGIFSFTYTEDGKTKRIPTRFSFVYEKGPDGKLLIWKQHTSDMPL